MGFKQLKQFNLALLAKQGWWLQMGGESLLYLVFKAKYFPNCDFIQAKLGSNPSYAWCSILAAQQILEKGIRWQVGNGKKIKIWQDRWLPTPSSYKVISPPPLPLDVSWVGDLIDHDLGVWKFDLLKRLFMPYEADLIASIALSLHLSDDKLVWAPTSNGKFSV